MAGSLRVGKVRHYGLPACYDLSFPSEEPSILLLTTFDFHIMRRVLGGFVLLVLALIIFFIVLHYVEFMDDFMDRGASLRSVLLVYYPSYIPDIVRLTSPLALFLACVYVTGKLAQELQIVALQTSGVSLYRLLLPYAISAAVVTGFMFWFNGWIVPVSNRTVLDFERKYLREGSAETDVADVHRQERPGRVVTVGYFDRETAVAHNVSIEQFEEGSRLTSRLDADRLSWNDSLGVWRAEGITKRTFMPEGGQRLQHVVTMDTTLNLFPRDFARDERDVETMTVAVAQEYVESLQRSGAGNLGRTLVVYYSRFAYPFANLLLALMAVPLASRRRRGGQAVQLGVGLLTAFTYLAVMKLTEPFGYSGELPPALTAWLPHALFAVLAGVLIVRAGK